MKKVFSNMQKIYPDGRGDKLSLSVSERGKNWEMSIEWEDLGDRYGYCPQFQAFDDSWVILPQCPELFEALAGLGDKDPLHVKPAEPVTVEQVEKALRKAGWKEDKSLYRNGGK